MPSTATTMAKLEGQVHPASAAGDDGSRGQEATAAGLIEQKLSQEACKEFAVTVASIFGTMMLLDDMPQALVDHADQPALLMLELSARLCLLFYLWVVFITQVLTRDRHSARRLSVRVLLYVLAWIISAVAVSGALADTAIGIVTAMLVMYIVTLCIAGLFAWCLGEYLQTRNSTEPTSTSTSRKLETTIAPDESKDNLLQTKSSAKAKLGHELNAQDLEAGLLIFEAQQLITSEA